MLLCQLGARFTISISLPIIFKSIEISFESDDFDYSDPSLYRASPIAVSLFRGIFYSES